MIRPIDPLSLRSGSRIVYKGTFDEQVKWGGCDDPRGKLEIGETYIVETVYIGTWHSKVGVLGVAGMFPLGAFRMSND